MMMDEYALALWKHSIFSAFDWAPQTVAHIVQAETVVSPVVAPKTYHPKLRCLHQPSVSANQTAKVLSVCLSVWLTGHNVKFHFVCVCLSGRQQIIMSNFILSPKGNSGRSCQKVKGDTTGIREAEKNVTKKVWHYYDRAQSVCLHLDQFFGSKLGFAGIRRSVDF